MDFIGKRKLAYLFSAFIILIGIGSIIIRGGLNLGVDFAGGVLAHIEFNQAVNIEDIRKAFEGKDIGQVVQGIGLPGENQFRIRSRVIAEDNIKTVKMIKSSLEEYFNKDGLEVKFLSSEVVGPTIGKELSLSAIKLFTIALILIIIYIAWRFEFRFAIAAIIALLHDVLITIGVFSISGNEITIAFVAAALTIVGYSLNDTIVVFDRIRENFKKLRNEEYSTIFNVSINETLSRTLITSLTTLFTVLSLFIFGGPVIRDFSFALLIGVLIGTYSSIFIASPILVDWHNRVRRIKAAR